MSEPLVLRQRPIPTDVDLPDNLHPLLARLYAARGVTSSGQLERSLQALERPDKLDGLEQAVAILSAARAQQHRIIIVGDFDADGATSCAVAVTALMAMGFEHVQYLVPNRFEFGYGLTPEIVEIAAQSKPHVLITVDNGIASLQGVRAAIEAGMQVIVTDHHLPGAELPAADAIVNPNVATDQFPSKNLAGVGVIFYVMLALRAALRKAGVFSTSAQPDGPNLAELLDLVALGTVADVVPLDHNNRVLVHQGLVRIRAARARPGIAAMLRVAGRDASSVTAADLAFAIGPRLNAAGRLTDMSLGIECLLSSDLNRAMEMASELDALNRDRREIETSMRNEAERAVATLKLDGALPSALCLYAGDWHPGVVGIVASRIKDATHRPVVAFADDNAVMLKGSARSVPGLHIRDALDSVATRHPGLVEKFGGHAMAAGLTLAKARLEEFRAALAAEVEARCGGRAFERVVWTDGELPARRLTLELAETLRAAGPWGQAFAEPLFEGDFDILEERIVGGHHLKLKLRAAGATSVLDAIAFNHGESPTHAKRARVVYQLDVNEYRGVRSLQLLVQHVLPGYQ